ncbi:MAG TPA: ATP-binding protein, partial [Armatimonadota bacterium]|nr:ATP-binding protein [Armatimonadota bacterium]
VSADFRDPARSAQVALVTDLPEHALFVRGDRVRLAQLVGNLLHNALKFTGPGGEVAVSLRSEPEGGRVSLTVADTGIGIPQELLPSIFETFVQGEQSLDRSAGGLGLGLALVKGLAELHGGEVAVSSDGPGCGACFTLTLPRADEPVPAVPAGGRVGEAHA